MRYKNEYGAFDYVFNISSLGCVINFFSNITFDFKMGKINIKKAVKNKDFFDNIIIGAFESAKKGFGD